MSALLLAIKHQQQRIQHARTLARIAIETGSTITTMTATAKLPGDPWAIRGIPAIGGRGSIGGAIRGSRPGDGLT